MTIPPVSFRLHDEDFSNFAEQLGASFERYGFAIVSDHGIDPAVIARAEEEAKALFALPTETKLAYQPPDAAGQRGYVAFGREAAKGAALRDLKEFWHVGRDLPRGHPFSDVMPANLWPNERPAFRPAMQGLYGEMEALGVRLLAAVARHLGLADDAMADSVRDGNSILRLLHYPPVEAGAEGVRAAAHEDINTLTLLLSAEEAGLELLDRDGRWLPVAPPAGAVVVNIGDMLQRLTNHALPSTSHRVVNPSPERAGVARYSMPFFLHFRPDFVIETLPSCIAPDRPDRYPNPITADAYLKERLREIRLA